jgi:hypothetical protein
MPDIRIRTVAGRPVPQINVKDRANYYSDPEIAEIYDELGERRVSAIYEGVQEDFWYDVAPDIAGEHGYGPVFSDGRSSGWLYVSDCGAFLEYLETDSWQTETIQSSNYYAPNAIRERDRFLAFASDIEGAVRAAQEMFLQRLKEAHADLERRREDNAIRSNN